MAELEFEHRLERMFAAPPHFADADLFNHKVSDRLERGWSLRRLVIGAAGGVGGLIGVVQVAQSGAFGQLQSMVMGAARGIEGLTRLRVALEAGPLQGEVVWMTALMAAAAVAFAVTRLVEEF